MTDEDRLSGSRTSRNQGKTLPLPDAMQQGIQNFPATVGQEEEPEVGGEGEGLFRKAVEILVHRLSDCRNRVP